MGRIYIAIDLKSYYASVECVERNLDPLTTNLVVADASRTEKTICLAVSPSLKAYGIPGRARLFEVVQKVKTVNAQRGALAPGRKLTGSSFDANVLKNDPSMAVDYIVATPRMNKYMEISSRIFNIYLKYVSPEDVHVYSVDECFIDVTEYLSLYRMSAKELCMTMIRDVLSETGITATAGVGTNLFLCKIAMDIVAKHMPPDENGVRLAELDERKFREELWSHEPLTDFWRIGPGIAKKLKERHIFTMGDIARCSLGLPPVNDYSAGIPGEKILLGADGRALKKDSYYNEQLLYKLFGVNAELLIDHAWGYEPATIAQIKDYKPESNSLSSGQVLSRPYSFDEISVIVREMTDGLVLDLVEKGLVTDQMVLTLVYDTESKCKDSEAVADYYGRSMPKPAHGSINLGRYTSSTRHIVDKVMELLEQIAEKTYLFRRVYVVANHVFSEGKEPEAEPDFCQMSLFDIQDTSKESNPEDEQREEQEKNLQKAMISIKNKYGKNAVLKGTNFREGSTAIERNGQVGGHKG